MIAMVTFAAAIPVVANTLPLLVIQEARGEASDPL